MRLAYFMPCARLTLRDAASAIVVTTALGLGGCAADGGGRNQRQSDASTGDTHPVLKQGGDVPPQPARLDRTDPPLVQAARGGDVKRVRALLDRGADVNAFGNGRTTALMAAAEAGSEDVAQLLI